MGHSSCRGQRVGGVGLTVGMLILVAGILILIVYWLCVGVQVVEANGHKYHRGDIVPLYANKVPCVLLLLGGDD